MSRKNKSSKDLAELVANDLKLLAKGLIKAGLLLEESWVLQQHSSDVKVITSLKRTPLATGIDLEKFKINPALYTHAKEYYRADQEGNYTFKLIDGGMIEINSMYRNNALIKQRLLYMQRPYSLAEVDFQDLGEVKELEAHDEPLEMERKSVNDSQAKGLICIRFDFDPNPDIAKELVHPRTHLTISNFKTCRIPISNPMTSKQFIELIIGQFYTYKFDEIVKFLNSNKSKFMEKSYGTTFFTKETTSFRFHSH